MSEGKCLVLSDMHFGTDETSINDPGVIAALGKFLHKSGPWKEIIFSGDLLDLNLATMTAAIEGVAVRGIQGFRNFIRQLGVSQLPVQNWVYVPGNHDYFVWDMLSTDMACVRVLASGSPLGKVPLPYKKGEWVGEESFISGVFPANQRSKVIVSYPARALDCNGKKILITHGHYLDKSQTEGRSLLTSRAETGNVARAVRDLVIETAQYQSIAHAVSYTYRSRWLVNLLFGPGHLIDRIQQAWAWFRYGDSGSILRGRPIDELQLRAIEFFLMNYLGYSQPPDIFIFGHTHVWGKDTTSRILKGERWYPNKTIAVYNAGSFLPKGKILATFIVVDPARNPEVACYGISEDKSIEQLL
jgi:predicted phosphodiesterase